MSRHGAFKSPGANRSHRWRWNRLVAAGALLAAATFSGCATSTFNRPPASPQELAVDHGRRFDQVETLVRTRYYDRDLRGVNWTELCARHRPHAVAATDDATWYRAVNGMLQELRDAHTRAERPATAPSTAVRFVRDAAAPLSDGGTASVLADGTVVLRFDHFDRTTVRWLARQIAHHRDAPGMIIDLRWNRGGWVTSNQRAVGLFFRDHVTIGYVTHRNGRRVVERSRSSGPANYAGPVALLVGRDSHSSAEVFARVLQYYGRAVVIGMPTAGEVLGARPYRLSDGGRLYVSTSDFTCCDGWRLEGVGVMPDVTIIGMSAGLDLVDDPAVAAAREELAEFRPPAARCSPRN